MTKLTTLQTMPHWYQERELRWNHGTRRVHVYENLIIARLNRLRGVLVTFATAPGTTSARLFL
jgi:hypothetical protein